MRSLGVLLERKTRVDMGVGNMTLSNTGRPDPVKFVADSSRDSLEEELI